MENQQNKFEDALVENHVSHQPGLACSSTDQKILNLQSQIKQLESDKRELVWLLKEIHEDGDLLPMAYGLEGGEQIRDAAERLIKKHTPQQSDIK